MAYLKLIGTPRTARGVVYACECVLGGDSNSTPSKFFYKHCIYHGIPIKYFYIKDNYRPYPNSPQNL